MSIVGISTGAAFLYAMTDEFHQGFVAGRTPKVMDVMIDTAGAFAGTVFLVFIWFLIEIKQKSNSEKNS